MGLKTKLAMAVATSAAGAAMIAGGSFALFTANAGSVGNTFTAGTITLTPGGLAWSKTEKFHNMAPGDSGPLGTVTLTNNGSLDEWVQLSVDDQGTLFGTSASKHPLQVAYTVNITSTNSKTTLNTTPTVNGVTLKQLEPSAMESTNGYTVMSDYSKTKPDTQYIFLPANSKATIDATFNFPSTAGNNYQNATGTMNISAMAVQAAHNTESASNDMGAQPISMS